MKIFSNAQNFPLLNLVKVNLIKEGNFMEQNYFNVKFINMLLEEVSIAFDAQELPLKDQTVSRWGCSDDFIYSEYLSKHFEDMLPCERKAIMQIIRTVINASCEAYFELIEDNYLCYEEFDRIDGNLGEFINRLKADETDC